MDRLRVGILMGGKSQEREVSYNSGRTVCDHLDEYLYVAIPIFQTIDNRLYILPWKFLHRGKIADFEHRLAQEAEEITWDILKTHIDFAYIAMHGSFAEDGRLQGVLETLRIPYLGSKILASACGMNKVMQKKMLANELIKVPRGIDIPASRIIHNKITDIDLQRMLSDAELHMPLIVKPAHEGSSLGVSIATDTDMLMQSLKKACAALTDHKQSILIEEKIEGMEFSCVTLFDTELKQFFALPPTEIVYTKGKTLFDYEQKYMPGQVLEFTPARCPQEIIDAITTACTTATTALGMCTLSRTDGFVTSSGEIVIVDVNSFSGMAPSSFMFREAAHINMNHPQLINYLIRTELYNYPALPQPTMQYKNHSQPRLRVAVLFGGDSNEREISLESGRNIIYKLDPIRYEALPLFVDDALNLYYINQRLLVSASTQEIALLVTDKEKINWHALPKLCDFVFIGLHGGSGENGAIQGMLEMLGLPYNGSGVLPSALCINKHATNRFLASQGLDVPKGMLIQNLAWAEYQTKQIALIEAQISYPMIVKPHDDGCSVMVHKVSNPSELIEAIDAILTVKSSALIEECITGMELTIGVIGNQEPRALIPSQAIAQSSILSIQEKFLPGAGENQTPAPISSSATLLTQEKVVHAYTAIGCKGYARIDCFYQNAPQSPTGQERVIILEINTLPGMTPATCIFHQAAEEKITPREFISMIIELGLQEHANMTSVATSTVKTV